MARRDADTLLCSSALLAALEQCEAGDWNGIRQLRDWNGGRLKVTLDRLLGDPELADRALESALDDIWRHAGAHRAADLDPEDWLFGRLRQVAQGYRSQAANTAHLRPVPQTPPPNAPAVTEWVEPAPEVDLAPTSPVNARLRRPSAPVQSRAVAVRAPIGAAPGRWKRLAALWLVAGTIGFGIAFGALRWLTTSPAPMPSTELSPSMARPDMIPSDVVEPAAPPRPSQRDLLGPPLAAPEPPTTLAPGELSRPSAESNAPTSRATPAPVSITIHHGTDAESREVAQRLADQLRRAGYAAVELRPETLEIGAASIRFFHTADKLAAQQLVNALGPFLVWQGRGAPTTPIDFTDFRPQPSVGSIEVWLPRR
ncbi:MAG: hypothetical protein U1E52_02675 [Geminicoccaceae bacterium]